MLIKMTVLHRLSWFLVTLLNQRPLHSAQTINPGQEKLLWKEQKTREEEPQLRRSPLRDGQHWCQQYIYLQINGNIGVRVWVIKNIYRMNTLESRGARAHQSTVAVVWLAECFTNMWSSCRSGPGSVLCLRQRGLCGKGPCHAIRMCGSVLWVLRKRARSAALSAGLITAWKNWGQQERHARILPRPGRRRPFTANNPGAGGVEGGTRLRKVKHKKLE